MEENLNTNGGCSWSDVIKTTARILFVLCHSDTFVLQKLDSGMINVITCTWMDCQMKNKLMP